MIRSKPIAKMLGILMLILSAFMATSNLWSLYYREQSTIIGILRANSILVMVAIAFYFYGRSFKGLISRKEALIVVGFGWFLAGALGSLPYLFCGVFDSFTDAFFETVSGFTTTGSTVLSDIESVPKGILFWRSLTQWLGGMGIIVLFVAVLPHLGFSGKVLFKHEIPGPLPENLRPRIKETARALWKIYLGFSAAETMLLMLGGMNLFDALCHTFSTMSTGGYSTKNASIGHFNSEYIELIVIIFMFIAGVNFSLYYSSFKGNIKIFARDIEFRVYFCILAVSILFLMLDIHHIHSGVWESLRYGAFQAVAIATTTGFGTDNFNLYPDASRILLVVLMFIGGCAGSTGGGMKVFRVIVLVKLAKREIIKIFHPNRVIQIRIGGVVLDDALVSLIGGYFIIFILIFVLGSLFMSLLGLDIITASSSVIATLSNIGPGLEKVGSIENYAFIPDMGKLFLSLCMVLGRLELFAIMVLFIPDFWRK